VDERKFIGAIDLQSLRLLRAFFKIGDPGRRQEIIVHAEELASSSIPDGPLVQNDSPSDETH
jgi:hypothetical protein